MGSPRPPQRPPLLRGSGPWIGHTCQSQMFQESLLSAAFHVVKIDTFGLRFFPQLLSTLSKFFAKLGGWTSLSSCLSQRVGLQGKVTCFLQGPSS